MITYFKMKIKQWKVKTMIYDVLLKFSERKDKFFEIADKLLISVKGESPEEVKKEFIDSLVEYICENQRDENNKTKSENEIIS